MQTAWATPKLRRNNIFWRAALNLQIYTNSRNHHQHHIENGLNEQFALNLPIFLDGCISLYQIKTTVSILRIKANRSQLLDMKCPCEIQTRTVSPYWLRFTIGYSYGPMSLLPILFLCLFISYLFLRYQKLNTGQQTFYHGAGSLVP